MALVATPGAADSNSYCSLLDANTYHTLRGKNTEWSTATDAIKQQNLAWATRQLDQLDWTGAISGDTQALRWPRKSVYDPDGRSVSETTIPRFLREATAEFAYQLLKEDWSQGLGSLVAKGDTKVGDLTTPVQEHNRIPASVQVMIAPYLKVNVNSNGLGSYGSGGASKGGVKDLIRS